MTDDHTLELLRRLDNRMTDLTTEVRSMRRSTDGQLGLIRQQLGSFLGFQRLQDESLQQLRERIERLERRLDTMSED